MPGQGWCQIPKGVVLLCDPGFQGDDPVDHPEHFGRRDRWLLWPGAPSPCLLQITDTIADSIKAQKRLFRSVVEPSACLACREFPILGGDCGHDSTRSVELFAVEGDEG